MTSQPRTGFRKSGTLNKLLGRKPRKGSGRSLLLIASGFAAIGALFLPTTHAGASVSAASNSGGGGTSTYSCVVAAKSGRCPASGYYTYPQISGLATNPWVNQNIWGARGVNYTQRLYANSPGDWYITASVSNNSSGAVLAFPNAGWSMPWPEQTLDSMSTITSSWNVTIPTDSQTNAGWAGYDLWFNNWADEVLIQTDIVANANYNCTAIASATFNGMPWHMCQFGSERDWKPGTDDNHLQNMPAGSLDIKPFLTFMEQHGYLRASSTWTAGSFGFEVCNTSGTTQTYKVNNLAFAVN
jgi:hypothetical protein